MQTMITTPTLAQVLDTVKPDMNSQLPLLSDSMIHHKDQSNGIEKERMIYRKYGYKPYGVSSSRRVLSPQLLLKKFDYVRDCLVYALGLTPAQREVTLRLLRYWAYYGNVYPKESSVTADPGCSKATFWRTIKLLEELGLLRVINRYVIRPHAQISNLYRLDRLVLVIAKYLAEHTAHAWPDWLKPVIHLTWPGLRSALRHKEKNAFLLLRSSGLRG